MIFWVVISVIIVINIVGLIVSNNELRKMIARLKTEKKGLEQQREELKGQLEKEKKYIEAIKGAQAIEIKEEIEEYVNNLPQAIKDLPSLYADIKYIYVDKGQSKKTWHYKAIQEYEEEKRLKEIKDLITRYRSLLYQLDLYIYEKCVMNQECEELKNIAREVEPLGKWVAFLPSIKRLKESEDWCKMRLYYNERIEIAVERLSTETDTPKVLAKVAVAWADYQELIWKKAIEYLTEKKRPITFEKAEDYRKQLKEYKDNIFVKYKDFEYKYEYLISLFPELQDYIDGSAIKEEPQEIGETYEDRREEYLSNEEWAQLSDTEKSQLALDRYNERRKRTNAQVGRDYEEYIAHLFRVKLKGCDVAMFGEQKGLNDLGRDLIVKHRGKVYIVQCKRWSSERVIREKHIMQLFGSTIEYCWESRKKGLPPLEMVGKSVIPVFVATTDLSDTAKQFTERLGVVFVKEEMGDYPQIKCNVGNDGERIYHLPFDQQYNRVIIEPRKKEFMAWTVEEAEQKGFRRAKKFYYD